MGSVSAPEEVYQMANQRTQDLGPIPHSSRASREVHDEHAAPGSSQSPGKRRIGRLRQSMTPDSLGEPWRFPIQDGGGGLRRNVPRAEARSPGRDDHIHPASVSPFQEKGDDRIGPVRHDRPARHFVPLILAPSLQDLAADVVPFPPAAGI
jgi:hypothetical protein